LATGFSLINNIYFFMDNITFISFIFFKLSYIIKTTVLGGELAVPCNSQSAIVRLNSRT